MIDLWATNPLGTSRSGAGGRNGGSMSEQPREFIVVGVDGSPQSIKALHWAVRHAQLLSADVRVVGAWEVPDTIWLTPGHVEADYLRDAREAFDAAVDAGLAGVEVADPELEVSKLLVSDRPGRALLDQARGALSLVVGSHGAGNTYPGMHLGSTASYCVHHAPCPVVVIREAVAE
jgi:nucleotide-binding universal stress UspA family protein